MPENDPAQSSSATSGTPTSGDPGTAATTANDGPNYVYGADSNVAEWKKFKTPEELDELTDQMYNIMVQGKQVPGDTTAAPAPVTPVASLPAIVAPSAIPDADAWLSDSAAAADTHFNARIADVQKNVLGPQLAGIYAANAQTARALAVQSSGDAFTRWGPEIDMQMSAIPVEQRNFQMYSEAVKLVKGAHAAEITREALDKAVADEIERRTAAGTIRSGDAGTGVTLSESLDFNSDNLGSFSSGSLCDVDAEVVLYGIAFGVNEIVPHWGAIALRAELCGAPRLARVADEVEAVRDGIALLAILLGQLKAFPLVAVALYMKH